MSEILYEETEQTYLRAQMENLLLSFTIAMFVLSCRPDEPFHWVRYWFLKVEFG